MGPWLHAGRKTSQIVTCLLNIFRYVNWSFSWTVSGNISYGNLTLINFDA